MAVNDACQLQGGITNHNNISISKTAKNIYLEDGIRGLWRGVIPNVRRGAASVNLDVEHPDISEFLQIRRPKGDPNRQCLNLHQCVVVGDNFMRKLEARDPEAMQ